jgi:hypothetical protein
METTRAREDGSTSISLVGAAIADNLTVNGGSGFHYDQALSVGGVSPTLGTYTFASWFEDNSAPVRKIYY